MKLSVIGCGYLGAVHAASMASLGHTVVGIDVDHTKIAKLSAGEPPFHEPGLTEVLTDGLASGRLATPTTPTSPMPTSTSSASAPPPTP